MGLLAILLSRDKLGHPMSLNYKGAESHQTILGSILSIVI